LLQSTAWLNCHSDPSSNAASAARVQSLDCLEADGPLSAQARKEQMRQLTGLLIWPSLGVSLLCAQVARAGTYYIDYSGGSDSNNGTSKATPWQRQPYMVGFSGSYSHSGGDRFIFKGGVTWPVSVFQMHITAGGSGNGTPDYYGVDSTWYAGSAWTRPLFDFQHTLIASGWTAASGVNVDSASYVTFDGLELANHRAPLSINGVSSWGTCSLLVNNASSYITISNCVIRDWDLPTPVPAGSDGGGGIWYVGTGGGSGIVVSHCVLHQAGTPVKSGRALSFYGEVGFCEVYQTANVFLGAGVIHDNHFHNIVTPTDAACHPNVIETFGATTAYGNLIHDLDSGVAPIFLTPDWSGGTGIDLVYNNVVYNCGYQAPLQLDTGGAHPGQIGVRAYNNTFEHGGSPCIRVVERSGAVYGVLDVRNNHLITSGTPVLYNNPTAGGANVASVTMTANLVQTPAQASASGYTTSNQFAPTSSGSPTVNIGLDLSSVFTTDIQGQTRPAGAWDVGAYQYGAGANPPPKASVPAMTTSKGTYSLGEAIVANFSNASGSAGDWIGLYVAGTPNTVYLQWNYTDGTQVGTAGITSGSVSFPSGFPNAGGYEARLFFNGTYTPQATVAFTVQSAPPGQACSSNPAANATGVGLSPTLSWMAGAGATSHQVYFGTNPTPGAAELKGSQSGTSYSPGALTGLTTYYWRIDEVNAQGTTPGVVWSFTTANPATLPTVTTSKGTYSPGEAIVVNFSNASGSAPDWIGLYAAGAANTAYLQWFYTDGTQVGTAGLTSGSVTFPSGFPNVGSYEARLFFNGSYTLQASAAFSVQTAPPGQASNPSPAANATGVALSPTLSWTAGAGATSHTVYFGTNPTPGAAELKGSQSGTSYSPGALTGLTTYYWRIDEVNAQGTTPGVVWSFTTGTAPSAPSVTTSQASYQRGNAISVNFSKASGSAKDWIGLFTAGAPNTAMLQWFYTDGTRAGTAGITSGKVNFPSGLPNAGKYEARLFFNNSYTSQASASFAVQ
jgi:hypothetical protein